MNRQRLQRSIGVVREVVEIRVFATNVSLSLFACVSLSVLVHVTVHVHVIPLSLMLMDVIVQPVLAKPVHDLCSDVAPTSLLLLYAGAATVL